MPYLISGFEGTAIKVGFIHLPATPKQNLTSLDTDKAVRALQIAVAAI